MFPTLLLLGREHKSTEERERERERERGERERERVGSEAHRCAIKSTHKRSIIMTLFYTVLADIQKLCYYTVNACVVCRRTVISANLALVAMHQRSCHIIPLTV